MSIVVERRERVAVVTIDRPQRRNALDPEHNAALEAALDELDADRRVRAVVVTGAGDVAFCAGADLATLLPPFQDAVERGESPRWHFGGITDRREDFVPTVAAVNGHALAGGLELALACDLRICSPNATFGLVETRWGITPGAGGTWRLPRVVPPTAALQMVLTAEPVGAQRALAWGLVTELVPPEALVVRAIELAEAIAARGPLAVRAARRAVLAAVASDTADLERELFVTVMRSDDAREGARAFAQKRPPDFRGT